MYLGLYLFFKKKKPEIILGINGLSLVCLLFFLLLASSIFDEASMSIWFNYFNNNLGMAKVSSLKVDISKISVVGGGLIGYFFYSLLVTLLDNFMANVVIFVVIIGCLYILFRKPAVVIYKKCKNSLRQTTLFIISS